MTGVMLLWNYLITPLYMNVPRDVVVAMLPTAFLPFNLVKALMNGALTMLLYKPVVTALRKARLVPEHESSCQRPTSAAPSALPLWPLSCWPPPCCWAWSWPA